jgi:hypothetical protein
LGAARQQAARLSRISEGLSNDPIQFSNIGGNLPQRADWICPFDLTRPSQKSEIGVIAAFPAAFEASHARVCTKQVD